MEPKYLQCTDEELKASYRRLVRQWHPDKLTEVGTVGSNGGGSHSEDSSAEDGQVADLHAAPQTAGGRDEAIIKIQKAYAVLSDPKLRHLYGLFFCMQPHNLDLYGPEGVEASHAIEREESINKSRIYSIVEPAVVQTISNVGDGDGGEDKRHCQLIDAKVDEYMQKLYWRRFRQLPVQHVSNVVLHASLFKSVMGHRNVGLNSALAEHSVEVALDQKTKCGAYFHNLASQKSFGDTRGALWVSRQATRDTLVWSRFEFGNECSLTTSSTTKFTDTLWGTGYLALGQWPYILRLGGALHKHWGPRHKLQVTTFPQASAQYIHTRRYNDFKFNIQIGASILDAGGFLRLKYQGIPLTRIGFLVRTSVINGATIEAYCRRLLALEMAARIKLESRLILSTKALILRLKLVLNNCKVAVPIKLVSGEDSITWGLALGAAAAILPTIIIHAIGYYNETPPEAVESGREAPDLEKSNNDACNVANDLHSHFPGSIAPLASPMSEQHANYYEQELIQGPPKADLASIQVAIAEAQHLLQAATAVYKSSHLVIYLALYGDLSSVNGNAIVESFTRAGAADFKEWSQVLHAQEPFVGPCLAPLEKLQVLNVSNVLQSMVRNTTLTMSDQSKAELVGFARASDVPPQLFVCYGPKGGDIKCQIYRDDEMVLVKCN